MVDKLVLNWLLEAKRYLLGAEVLRNSDEYRRGTLLITPTLHLVAHGIELFLKASLIRGGGSEADARKFSHDILGLWKDVRNIGTRDDVLMAATEEWEVERQNPNWSDDFGTFDSPPLEEYLERLSQLHSKATDHALRYVGGRTPDMAGPKPHLLSATFYRVVKRFIREMTDDSQ